jgi:uncharacterized membrane protein YeaQ/YmgE (transglycosylase-associated protein family)
MVLSPAFTFGLLIATLYGALAHLLMGGDGRRLMGMIFAAWVGFAIGQAVGQVMGIRALPLGSINLLSATLGSLMVVALVAFLAHRRSPSSRE